MRFPTVKDILPDVISLRDDARTYDRNEITEFGCDEPSIDIRLQVDADGGWHIHTGDSSYDQDHRGYWGTSSVSPDDTVADCRNTARSLIDDAREHKASAQ